MCIKKELKQGMLVLLILGCSVLIGAGCSHPIVLRPISDVDIFNVPRGTIIGDKTTQEDGFFLSNTYMKETGYIKVEN